MTIVLRPEVLGRLEDEWLRQANRNYKSRQRFCKYAFSVVEKVRKELQYADAILQLWPGRKAEIETSELPDVLLSIALLSERLRALIAHVLRPYMYQYGNARWPCLRRPGELSYEQVSEPFMTYEIRPEQSLVISRLAKLLVKSGWCPARAKQLVDQHNSVTLLYRLSGICR